MSLQYLKGSEDRFLEILNCEFPNMITFKIKKEVEGKIPFLDILIIRSQVGIKTTVYRKPTHSDKYVEFKSHHPRHVMTGILGGMVDRALAICDQEYLGQELEHLRNTLKKNGYPAHLIDSIIQRKLEGNTRVKRPASRLRLILPYYAELGEKIKRLGNRLGFQVWFKGNPNLRSILRNDKGKVPLDQCPGVVYEIKCECLASYVGETGNTLAHRFKEHMEPLTRYRNAMNRLNGDSSNISRGRPPTLDPTDAMEQAIQTSAVAQHATQCTGQLRAEVLCKERQFMIRKIKEALYIKFNSNINRDSGIAISDSWTNIIRATSCCLLHGSPAQGQ
ncbi:hypothetical protein M514_21563 [Trichuris suis]|uniref:Helix-turn-helix domain-containing protein n=1 Tax=Trichuris suis TaxID=68888 RepID=A0A085N9Y0_9BILA|nr:hypothetical protein M514_21563 [Trichuris suis]